MIDNNRRQPPNRNTSLPLILLTLIVGIAFGWLLHDLIRGPAPPVAEPAARPAAGVQQPAANTPHPTRLTPTQSAPAAESAAPAPTPTVRATATPAPAPEPTANAATPAEASPPPRPTAPPEIAGYAGHVVAPGETLEQIAAQGGSTPALIASYNLLGGVPQPGRALIVPRLVGETSGLVSEPLLVRRGREDKPWVALTLDAGAGAGPVPSILKTLREHGAKITFFLTGKWIEENPDLARQIVADGHEIANHTVNHPDLRNLDDASIRKELAGTEQMVAQTIGATSRPFFRPPFGAYD